MQWIIAQYTVDWEKNSLHKIFMVSHFMVSFDLTDDSYNMDNHLERT